MLIELNFLYRFTRFSNDFLSFIRRKEYTMDGSLLFIAANIAMFQTISVHKIRTEKTYT